LFFKTGKPVIFCYIVGLANFQFMEHKNGNDDTHQVTETGLQVNIVIIIEKSTS